MGPYRIVGCIGAGASGQVYRAEHVELERPVALKLLTGALLDPTARERFVQEGRLAARVTHPNVVRVLDIGTHGDRPFLVFEMIEGPTLRTHLADGAPPLPEALGLIREGAKGLAAIHAAGILHRDIKPANIFVNAKRGAVIGDLGLACCPEQSAGLTRTGTFLGTVAYASPEAARCETLTPATDVFSLGLVALECFGRALPSGRPSLAEMFRDRAARPVDVERTTGPGLPGDVLELLAAMLAFDPRDRIAPEDVIRRVDEISRRLGRRDDRAALPVAARPGTLSAAYRLLTVVTVLGVAVSSILHATRPAATSSLPARSPATLVSVHVAPAVDPPVLRRVDDILTSLRAESTAARLAPPADPRELSERLAMRFREGLGVLARSVVRVDIDPARVGRLLVEASLCARSCEEDLREALLTREDRMAFNESGAGTALIAIEVEPARLRSRMAAAAVEFVARASRSIEAGGDPAALAGLSGLVALASSGATGAARREDVARVTRLARLAWANLVRSNRDGVLAADAVRVVAGALDQVGARDELRDLVMHRAKGPAGAPAIADPSGRALVDFEVEAAHIQFVVAPTHVAASRTDREAGLAGWIAARDRLEAALAGWDRVPAWRTGAAARLERARANIHRIRAQLQSAPAR